MAEVTDKKDNVAATATATNEKKKKGTSQDKSLLGAPTKLLRKKTLVRATDISLPVHTLTFAIPDKNGFSGKALHHSEINVRLGDTVKMVIPNYKPKSYSVSALRDTEFDITFKVYPNGRASVPLDRLEIGQTMRSFGKSANRVRNALSGGGELYVGIVAYGVGITEGLPVARAELNDEDTAKVVLLWASRTEQDTFWKDDIEQLQQEYLDKFEMNHIYSREKREGCLHGRIDLDILKQVFQPTNPDQARFLSVGTKEMMQQTEAMWVELGYKLPQNLLLPKQKDLDLNRQHKESLEKELVACS